MASRQAGAAGRSRGRQRVVNQPSASVTELGVCSKELRGGESLSLMKETSALIESGYSPAARDRPQRLIHISCFVPLRRDKARCKRWGSPAQQGWEPEEHGGEKPRAASRMGWHRELGWVFPRSLQDPREDEVSTHLLSGSGFWGSAEQRAARGSAQDPPCLLEAFPDAWLQGGCSLPPEVALQGLCLCKGCQRPSWAQDGTCARGGTCTHGAAPPNVTCCSKGLPEGRPHLLGTKQGWTCPAPSLQAHTAWEDAEITTGKRIWDKQAKMLAIP